MVLPQNVQPQNMAARGYSAQSWTGSKLHMHTCGDEAGCCPPPVLPLLLPLPRVPRCPWPCLLTLILILLFQRGLSMWYTTSKRAGRSGKSTAVMSIRHLNCVLT